MTLPNGWADVQLGELTQFVTSGSRGWAKYYADQGAAFIRIQNVQRRNVTLDLSDVQYVLPPVGAERERTTLQPNDVLVTITADLGRIGLFQSESTAYVNQHVALVRPIGSELAPYIASYLTTDEAQAQMGLKDRGVTRAGLGLDDIRGVNVQLPPQAEQRRIVAKLDALTARLARARAELDRVSALAENLRRSAVTGAFRGELTTGWRANNPGHRAATAAEADKAYRQVVGQKRRKASAAIDWHPEISLPDCWRWASVDEIVGVVQYGSSAKTSYTGVGVPVLRMGNIQRGEIDWTKLKHLPREYAEFPELFLAEGDVLFNRTNSFELVGKSAVYRGAEGPASFASYLIRVRCSAILPDLLVRYLNSPFGRAWVEQTASQQVGQANVNGSKLKALGIPLPPAAEQAEMLRQLDAVFARADRLEAEASRARALLDRLEDAILAKAFRGKLVPQDPADEPATALLARIRTQRASAPKPKRGRRAVSGA